MRKPRYIASGVRTEDNNRWDITRKSVLRHYTTRTITDLQVCLQKKARTSFRRASASCAPSALWAFSLLARWPVDVIAAESRPPPPPHGTRTPSPGTPCRRQWCHCVRWPEDKLVCYFRMQRGRSRDRTSRGTPMWCYHFINNPKIFIQKRLGWR